MSGTIGGSPIALYIDYAANESSFVSRNTVASPQTQMLVTHFTQVAASITSPSALLADPRALSVVLGAFNMSNQQNSTAVLQALMTQNPNSSTSLAYQSGNALWQRFAQQMSNWTPLAAPFASAANVKAISTAYQTNSFEAGAGAQMNGMQQALYFTRTASSVTSVQALLADTSQLQVALAATGIPYDTFGALDYNTQVSTLTAKINLQDFQNPTQVKQMAEQYLVQQQLTGGLASPTAAPGTLAGLFSGGTDTSGLFTILDSSSGTNTLLSGSSGTATLVSLFA